MQYVLCELEIFRSKSLVSSPKECNASRRMGYVPTVGLLERRRAVTHLRMVFRAECS